MTSMIALHQVIFMIILVSKLNRTADTGAYLGDCEENLLLNDPCKVGMMEGFCVYPLQNMLPCTSCNLKCEDVNECTRGTANCGVHATCTNTPGSFTCSCNSGYNGDGHNCTYVLNTCNLGTANCDVNAACTLIWRWFFICTCNSGYSGDGYTCTALPLSCVHGVEAQVTVDGTQYDNCTCDANYTGRYCDSVSALPVSCGNGVDAQVIVGTELYAICKCDASYFGRYCDSKDSKTDLQGGARVVRGPSWKWEVQDNFGPGTINLDLSILGFEGIVLATWDSGNYSAYRMGAAGAYDLTFI